MSVNVVLAPAHPAAVTKMATPAEAQRICPDMVIVNGENLDGVSIWTLINMYSDPSRSVP